ncbi:MAG: hypothetical protein ACK5NY_09665 [Burkholderiaceae bacterium]
MDAKESLSKTIFGAYMYPHTARAGLSTGASAYSAPATISPPAATSSILAGFEIIGPAFALARQSLNSARAGTIQQPAGKHYPLLQKASLDCAICLEDVTDTTAHPDARQSKVSEHIRSFWNCRHLLHDYCAKPYMNAKQAENRVPTCPECRTSELRAIDNPIFISYTLKDSTAFNSAVSSNEQSEDFADENLQNQFQSSLNAVLENLPSNPESSSAAQHDEQSLANALHKLANCLLQDEMVLTLNVHNSPESLSVQQPVRFHLNRFELLQKAVELAPKQPLYWFELAVQLAYSKRESVTLATAEAPQLLYNASDCLRKALSFLPADEISTSEIQYLSEKMLAEYSKSNFSKSWTLSTIDWLAQARDYESIHSFLQAHFDRQVNALGIQVDVFAPQEYNRAFCALSQGIVHHRGQLRAVQAQFKQGRATEADLTQKTEQFQKSLQTVAIILQKTLDFAKNGRIDWRPDDVKCCEVVFKLIKESIFMERDLSHEITSYETRSEIIRQLSGLAVAYENYFLSRQPPFQLSKTAYSELFVIQVAQGIPFNELNKKYEALLDKGLVDGKSLSALIKSSLYEMEKACRVIGADPKYSSSQKKKIIQEDATLYLSSAAKKLCDARSQHSIDIEHVQMAYAALLHMHTQFAHFFDVEVKASMQSVVTEMQKVPDLNFDMMHIPHILKIFKDDLLQITPTREIKLVLECLKKSQRGFLSKIDELAEWINEQPDIIARQLPEDQQAFRAPSRFRNIAKKIADAKPSLERLMNKFDEQTKIADPVSSQNPLVSAVRTLNDISKIFRNQIKAQVSSLPLPHRQTALAIVADYEKHHFMPSNALSILYDAAKQSPLDLGRPADRSGRQSSWRRGGDRTQTPALLPEQARLPEQRYLPPHARSAQNGRSSSSDWRSSR